MWNAVKRAVPVFDNIIQTIEALESTMRKEEPNPSSPASPSHAFFTPATPTASPSLGEVAPGPVELSLNAPIPGFQGESQPVPHTASRRSVSNSRSPIPGADRVRAPDRDRVPDRDRMNIGIKEESLDDIIAANDRLAQAAAEAEREDTEPPLFNAAAGRYQPTPCIHWMRPPRMQWDSGAGRWIPPTRDTRYTGRT